MNILDEWVNPYYLRHDTIEGIRESVLAKPVIRYAVLDNFFKEDKLDQLVAAHRSLSFSEELDRLAPDTGKWLPYDGAVVFARPGVHFGSELFFAEDWHRYLIHLSAARLDFPTTTEVKLRWHRPDADGFWIHTDSTTRSVVAICYFNKGWRASDGGLLQLWRVDEANYPTAFVVDRPEGRLDFLTRYQRIRTATPGGGFPDRRCHDLVLLDQIVPIYNRLFICNLQDDPAYHSVTPSNGRERIGFVQWIGVRRG